MKRTIALLLVAAAVVGGAVSAHAALQGKTSHQLRHSSGTTRHTAKHVSTSGIPAGVAELAQNDGVALGSLTKALSSDQGSIYSANKGDTTCIYLSGGNHAVGGCTALDGNSLAPRIGIVDGGTYAWGLADPQVTGVTTAVDGGSYAGAVGNGVFLVSLPDASHGSGSIRIVSQTENSSETFNFPGVPTPLP